MKFGDIDKTGKLAIPAVFDSASAFKDGLAQVELHSCADEHRAKNGVCQEGRTDRLGYIDPRGGYVWQPTLRR